MSALAEAHRHELAKFERRRYCSVAEAAHYLDIKQTLMRELLAAQKIQSQYIGGKLRKVVVASLLAYADHLPIDRPGGA